MIKIIVVNIGNYLIGIPNDAVSRVGKLKEDFKMTFQHFESWNILPLHRHLGYRDFPSNRRYLVFLNNSKIVFADNVIKILPVDVSPEASFPVIIQTKLGKVLLVHPDTVSAKQLKRYLSVISHEIYQQKNVKPDGKNEENAGMDNGDVNVSGGQNISQPELTGDRQTLSGEMGNIAEENVTYQKYSEHEKVSLPGLKDTETVVKDFHIITLENHFNEEQAIPPVAGSFMNFREILTEEENKKLIPAEEEAEELAPQILHDGEDFTQRQNTESDVLFAEAIIAPEDDVEIVIDEENFLNGKVKDDFYVPDMNSYVDDKSTFMNDQGIRVSFEEKLIQQKGARENTYSQQKDATETEQDDEDGCQSPENSSEDEIREGIVSSEFSDGEEINIARAFYDTINHEKTGNAFSDLFNNTGGDARESNREIEQEKQISQTNGISGQLKSVNNGDINFSDAEEEDEDKKSYLDRRDDEIEQMRQEILKAKEKAGGDSVTDIEVIRQMLEKEREAISKKSVEKEPLKNNKPARKKSGKHKKKKRRSFHLWIREMVFSAPFKITLILILIFAASISGIYFFERIKNKEMFKNLWDAFWYTIVTFTTVGYGDKYPSSFGGQIVGIFMMFVGVTLFSVVSGRITSYLVDLQIKRGKGLIKLQKLTNHFVICGWRKDFHLILDEILHANSDITNDEIVLINDVAIENMESIMSEEKYRGINYIRGDFLDESVLNRANIAKAKKALILADSSHDFSPQEADSRTVMAAITMESINKNIYVCAELLDSKFERYLKLAHVEEIILSRDYSRTLLANASAATGISHIITSLVSTFAEKGLTTENVPNEFIGDTFESLSMYFLDRDGSILIGLLENTGNFHIRKKEALIEAQKTPDISKLVGNLRTVKFLQANMPVINPGGDYMIKDHSKAIIIEGVSKIEREAIFGT